MSHFGNFNGERLQKPFLSPFFLPPFNLTFVFIPCQPPDEVRAAWKTPPISPVRPPSAQRRRDPDPGGVSNNRGDDSPYSTRPGKFVSKLRAEAHLASLGTTSVSRPPHVSSSDSGLSSRSGPIATAGIDQGTSWRSKSGYVCSSPNNK